MDKKQIEDLTKGLPRMVERLEKFRKAEAAIKLSGDSSVPITLWIDGLEFKITDPTDSKGWSHATKRGREMLALASKKLLQGRIEEEVAAIRELQKKIGGFEP